MDEPVPNSNQTTPAPQAGPPAEASAPQQPEPPSALPELPALEPLQPALVAQETAPSIAGPPTLTTAGTVLWTLAFLIGAGMVLFSGANGRDQLLEQPEAYLDRVVGRELDAAEITAHVPSWQRAVNAWDLDTPDDALKDAIDTYQRFQRNGILADSVGVRCTLAVLLREAGRTNEAQSEIEELPPGDRSDFQRSFAAAYSPSSNARAGRRTPEVVKQLTPEWARDKLAWRLAEREGNTASVARIVARLQRRGRQVLNHVTMIAGLNLGLVLSGLMVGGAWLVRRRPALVLGDGRTVSPWNVKEGYAVLVRGAVIGLILAGGLSMASELSPIADGVATVISALPMFWLARRYLLHPHGCGYNTCFGLFPRAQMAGTIAGVSLVVIALMLLGEMVLNLVTSNVQPSSLAESIPEELLFGSWIQVFLSGLDAIVWAPLVEETVFRGLLYPTLRRRLPVLAAAAVSSGIFGLAHGYSWQGFLVIWWSGFLWALAYEKSKSLWPGIICHALSNCLATLSPVLIYRL